MDYFMFNQKLFNHSIYYCIIQYSALGLKSSSQIKYLKMKTETQMQ